MRNLAKDIYLDMKIVIERAAVIERRRAYKIPVFK
jgi:hypothetical protein